MLLMFIYLLAIIYKSFNKIWLRNYIFLKFTERAPRIGGEDIKKDS
jgi:hypothetical protein